MPRHMDDFLYCDPPYYLDGDSRMFRGIYPQRNFPVHHKGFDHALLRDLLEPAQGRICAILQRLLHRAGVVRRLQD